MKSEMPTIRRSSGLFFILLAAFAVAASPSMAQNAANAALRSMTGDVQISSDGTNFVPAEGAQSIPAGTTIRTGADSSAVVVPMQGAAVQVASNTTVTLESLFTGTKRTAELQLRSGTVSALLDPTRATATDFRIRTPQGVAAARGTHYGVAHVNGQTVIAVKDGSVGFNK